MINALRANYAINHLYATVKATPEVNKAMRFDQPDSSLDYLKREVAEVDEALALAGHGSKRRVLEELGDVIVTAAVMVRNLGGSWSVVAREAASRIGRRVPKALIYSSRPWSEAWAKAKEDVG
jgi:NTP pyrophosphatase (non-canonical NTP hydrolase)